MRQSQLLNGPHRTTTVPKRSRAVQACTLCRQTKSKCDGQHPSCERCARGNLVCDYTQNTRDRRMDRQEERRAHLALANRVRELESRLAAAQSSAMDDSASSPESQVGKTSASSRARSFTQHVPRDDAASFPQPAPDSSADAIATGLFDEQPANADIGYFGASSNHAFFWALTSSLGESDKQRAEDQKLPSRHTTTRAGPRRLPLPPLKALTSEKHAAAQEDAFPGRSVAITWINRFFDTVGAILPYVSRSVLLREIDMIDSRTGTWQACPSETQALLNIVFAQALATSEDGAAEPFYRRALSLLDERGVYRPTIESLQALLLLASFQQNSQRAQESITTHFGAVKAAFQLGIHSPSSYGRLSRKDKELRCILWFAVIQLDRIVGSGLGRPFLIPDQHIRIRPSEMISISSHHNHGEMDQSRQLAMAFFHHIISLHDIVGKAVDKLHASNVSAVHELTLSELVPHVMDLLTQIEQLRANISPVKLLLSNVDLSTWAASDVDEARHAIVLSLYHYRATTLINAPLLLSVLGRVSISSICNGSKMHMDVAISILKTYLQTIHDFHTLLCSILARQPSFLRCNAVWWLCNYMMVSVNLHLLGLWLISTHTHKPETLPSLGRNSCEIESLMRKTLDTLKFVGGSSIMSRKAHRCLQKYLDLFTTHDGNPTRPTTSLITCRHVDHMMIPPPQVLEPGSCNFMPATTATSNSPGGWDSNMDDLLAGLCPEEFLGADLFAMGYDIGDFDVTGFI